MQTLFARTEFQTLIEAVPDALLMIDEQGQIALVNQQVEVLFGYSRQELLGQELEYLLPERFHTLHFRHRRSYVENPIIRPMGVGLELYGRRKDGSEFPVDISLSPLHTEAGLFIISSIRDITERHRLEHLARAHQALLQIALDALPNGVYLVQGEQARLVFVNRAAIELWGAAWLPGQTMHNFLHTHQIRVLGSDGRELTGDQLATYRALRTGQAARQYQEVIRRPNGTSLPIFSNRLKDKARLSSSYYRFPHI